MESVISVINIPTDFKNRIVSNQLKIDLEKKLDEIHYPQFYSLFILFCIRERDALSTYEIFIGRVAMQEMCKL